MCYLIAKKASPNRECGILIPVAELTSYKKAEHMSSRSETAITLEQVNVSRN